MKYLIHSTQPVPAHIADTDGRALCGCGVAAWKRTPARSGYKAGEWRLVDEATASKQAWDDATPLMVCQRCQRRQRKIKSFGGKK